MSASQTIDATVSLLSDLIGYKTDNPQGDELALCARLGEELTSRGAEGVSVVEVPRTGKRTGGYVYARYGTPKTLLNVHVDTVPANTGWTHEPFRATVTDDRVYGLGSADTKGAMAAILVALERGQPDGVGILFSGDEEAGSEVILAFVGGEHMAGIERAIVCEPTRRRAGVRHRGIRAYRATVHGKGGHSSGADHMPRPIVTMARLAVAIDELGREHREQGPPDMRGLCMNVAALDGGVAYNVVPDSASLRWSLRPPPGFDAGAFERQQQQLAQSAGDGVSVDLVLGHQPFACGDVDRYRQLIGDFVEDFVTLDFWTEAAVFAAHGVDAVVVGPGDIAQAHAPDEFVTKADLAWAVDLFSHVLAECAK